ncbi:MAG: MoaD/ThiS family protein [Nitrososphaerota archaeon]
MEGLGEVKVKVAFIHVIAKEVGVREEEVEVEGGASLKDLLDLLVRRHGEAFKKYVYDSDKGEVRGYAIVTVNGNVVQRSRVRDVKLNEGDRVFFGIGAGGG